MWNWTKHYTSGQHCPLCHEERKLRVTASYSGKILNVRSTKSYQKYSERNIILSIWNKIYRIRYVKRTKYFGPPNENRKCNNFSELQFYSQKISMPGRFIWWAHWSKWIGGNKVSVVGSRSVIEAVESGMVNLKKKISLIQCLSSSKKHPYYFQVQGKLEIADRDYCFFAVWMPKEKIYRDRTKNFLKRKCWKTYCYFMLIPCFRKLSTVACREKFTIISVRLSAKSDGKLKSFKIKIVFLKI